MFQKSATFCMVTNFYVTSVRPPATFLSYFSTYLLLCMCHGLSGSTDHHAMLLALSIVLVVFSGTKSGPGGRRILSIMNIRTSLSLVLFVVLYALCSCDESSIVSCGSVVKLKHKESGHHLHSHQIAWGSGSGQQSVTGHGSNNGKYPMMYCLRFSFPVLMFHLQ